MPPKKSVFSSNLGIKHAVAIVTIRRTLVQAIIGTSWVVHVHIRKGLREKKRNQRDQRVKPCHGAEEERGWNK